MGKERDKKWGKQNTNLERTEPENFYKNLDQISATILKLEKVAHPLQDAAFTYIHGGVGVQKRLWFLPGPTLIGL